MFYKLIFVLSVSTFVECISDLQSANHEKDFQNLSGSWEIYTGSAQSILKNEFNLGLWKTVPVPSNLKNFVNFPANSIVLRKHFELKTSIDFPLSISLGKISDHVQVRWNGQKLSEELFEDYQNSTPQGYDRTRIYSISEKKSYKKTKYSFSFGLTSTMNTGFFPDRLKSALREQSGKDFIFAKSADF
ncbi:hypothetical protein LEP1GSC123_3186 [Leptospira borgpetersenii str. 200701203]|uniref:Uncharacterized protein n=1 Tax=Leptospira borgpetersenii str. 200701203 TaxID=1193007 RepID=M3FA21_LEPBO|nr:hypothetical protein LEP1GSC123_3186 [Leptospira borgpetersenii str. 200701203]